MIRKHNGHEIIEHPTPQEQLLYRLQAEWAIATDTAKEAIAQDIADHPKGIRIDNAF